MAAIVTARGSVATGSVYCCSWQGTLVMRVARFGLQTRMPFQEGGDSMTDRRLHGLPFASSVDNCHFRAFGSGSEKALANGFQVGCALGFDAVWFSLNPLDRRFNWHVQ